MKTIHSIIVAFALSGLFIFLNAFAQPANETASVKIFVQKFYDEYNKRYNDNAASTMDYYFKNKKSYFGKALLNEYAVYDKAMPETADEIVGLDSDPILSAQDNGMDYFVGDVKQKGQVYYAGIYSELKGRGKAAALKGSATVVAEVSKENGQWKFVNFDYPPPDGNGTNLIGLLKNGEKEAKEYTAAHKAKAKH